MNEGSMRNPGKSFYHYQEFIASVKRGEKAIVFGDGYVVLSEKLYKEILNEQRN